MFLYFLWPHTTTAELVFSSTREASYTKVVSNQIFTNQILTPKSLEYNFYIITKNYETQIPVPRNIVKYILPQFFQLFHEQRYQHFSTLNNSDCKHMESSAFIRQTKLHRTLYQTIANRAAQKQRNPDQVIIQRSSFNDWPTILLKVC